MDNKGLKVVSGARYQVSGIRYQAQAFRIGLLLFGPSTRYLSYTHKCTHSFILCYINRPYLF